MRIAPDADTCTVHKVTPMYNEQFDAYEELEDKYQQTREKYGRLEVDYRLLQTQSSRYEKEAKSLSTQLQQEREKNFDLRRKNAELTEQTAYYKKELSRYRSSPMPETPSPALSAATTTKATLATRKPSGPLPLTPVWARSTVASRARSSLSPPNSTAFASSSDKKIRGQRNDGLSTSFATASPAIRVPSRAATDIGTSLPPAAKSSDVGDVSPLLLPGAGPALNDRQQRRQQLLKASMKTDTYATTPIAAAARDRFRAEQAQIKASHSKAPLESSVLAPSTQKQGPTTPQQKDAHDVLDSSDLPFFGNVNNAFEAGSPEKDDEEPTPKANSVQKLGITFEVERTTPRKPAGSPYQKAKVQDIIDSSSLLDDTLISESFELPGLGLFKVQTAQPGVSGRAPKMDAPKLDLPIDIGKMTKQNIAVTAAKKWGGGSKSDGEKGGQKLGKRVDGTDYKIKSNSFL